MVDYVRSWGRFQNPQGLTPRRTISCIYTSQGYFWLRPPLTPLQQEERDERMAQYGDRLGVRADIRQQGASERRTGERRNPTFPKRQRAASWNQDGRNDPLRFRTSNTAPEEEAATTAREGEKTTIHSYLRFSSSCVDDYSGIV